MVSVTLITAIHLKFSQFIFLKLLVFSKRLTLYLSEIIKVMERKLT